MSHKVRRQKVEVEMMSAFPTLAYPRGYVRRISHKNRGPKIIDENYERCWDLVQSSRFIRKKNDMKIEDILPALPKPDELKPFPTKENILYRGHTSFIISMI